MKYYNTCEELPLYNFIRCHVTGDVSYLLKNKEEPVDEQELLQTWESILNEYYIMSEESLDVYALSLYYEVESIKCQIDVIQNSVEILRTYYEPDLIELLEGYGYKFKFNPENISEYNKDLDRVLIRGKALLVQYNSALAQMDQIQAKSDSDKDTKISVFYYDRIISVLSKYMGVAIDDKTCTVSRYISILNIFNKEAETLRAKSEGDGRG